MVKDQETIAENHQVMNPETEIQGKGTEEGAQDQEIQAEKEGNLRTWNKETNFVSPGM